MKSYRLVIRQQGRIVGHFDTTGEAALEDACVARSLFGLAGGYQCELLVADSERRILGEHPGGIARLVPREVLSTGNLRGIKKWRLSAPFLCSKHYFLMRITGVSPTVTLPDSLISSLISSMLEITTGVRVDLAFSSSSGRSNSITGSPTFTR